MSWAQFEDASLASGFTQIPNAVVRRPDLSMQAKYMYGLLLSYAWQDSETHPGMERMKADTGAKVDTLRKYIAELVEAGLMEVQRRGQGRTNLYIFKSLDSKNQPPKGGNKTTPNGGNQENPKRGASKSPPTGGATNTQGNEYAVDEDSVTPPGGTASAVSGDSEANWFTVFCNHAASFDYEVTPDDRKELPKHLKSVSQEQDEKTMKRIVLKCLEARAFRSYPISPQRARDEVTGKTSPNGKKSEPTNATPEPGRQAVAEHEHLRRYAHLCEKWDFTSEDDPPYPVYASLGGTSDEQHTNLTRMRSVARRGVKGIHAA